MSTVNIREEWQHMSTRLKAFFVFLVVVAIMILVYNANRQTRNEDGIPSKRALTAAMEKQGEQPAEAPVEANEKVLRPILTQIPCPERNQGLEEMHYEIHDLMQKDVAKSITPFQLLMGKIGYSPEKEKLITIAVNGVVISVNRLPNKGEGDIYIYTKPSPGTSKSNLKNSRFNGDTAQVVITQGIKEL